MQTRNRTYAEAIREAFDQLLEIDPSVYVIGLGVPDPKGVFGTTLGLQEKHGADRVMDMPTSENAMTGIAIGSAIAGMRPILSHQRVDFALLSLDQIINNASKWHYMFGGKMKVPLVIRLIMGRGWGQGPQHSQSLHSLFAHIPGLKVVMPSNPYDAKGMLISSVKDDNPVIFFEHRWLHGIFGHVPEELYTVPLGIAKVMKEGTDITLVASSHMTLEAWRAVQELEKEGISAELIDLRTVLPIDKETLFTSVRKTGRVLILDSDWKTCGYAAEISALITENCWDQLKKSPQRLTYPDQPCPTSWSLSNHFYPITKDILGAVFTLIDRPLWAKKMWEEARKEKNQKPLDVPDASFVGPF